MLICQWHLWKKPEIMPALGRPPVEALHFLSWIAKGSCIFCDSHNPIQGAIEI